MSSSPTSNNMSSSSTYTNNSSGPFSNSWSDIIVPADTDNEYRIIYLRSENGSGEPEYTLLRVEPVDPDNTIHNVRYPEEMYRGLLDATKKYVESSLALGEEWHIVGEVFDSRLVLTGLEMPDWDRLCRSNTPSKAVLLEREGCESLNDNISSEDVCDRGCREICNESFEDSFGYPLERQQARCSARLMSTKVWEAWWKQRPEQQLKEEEEREQQLTQELEQEPRSRSVSFRSAVGTGASSRSHHSQHTKKMLADQRGEGLVLRKANLEAGTVREGWLKRLFRSVTKIGSGPEMEKRPRLGPIVKGRWHGKPIKA
ncbi:uncharacterized protein AB675_9079 [Cyphellophora attinorum]|uniref:Uncharacterized protein n=1 Tax=Cyphellophora attinorum TaxID=1664694 RepID=A0A0N1H6L5_9EURO|nr:uncharacterized protein AB675_9079 [Phialophora attinorum]KPI41726.1 hypothetical protein AB675_9079 [Phialophora attinorum]